MTLRRLVVVALLMELCYLSLYFVAVGPGEVLWLIGVNAAAYLMFSVVVWQMKKAPAAAGRAKTIVAVILAMGVIFRLTVVPHGVVGSDDIYRYLWDGKVSASGVNPYRYLPTDSALAHLATADLPSKVNHPELRSLYPALAQVMFLTSHVLFGDSAAGWKLLLVLIDSITMLLLWRLVRDRGPLPVLLYAWSPLPILYFGLDGHIDALGIVFLVVALLLFLTRRPVRGAIALGLASLAKLVPLILVPLLFRVGTGLRRVLILAVPFLVAALGYLLYHDPTWGVFESLRTFGSRWEFNGGIFSVVYFLTGSNETAHIVSTIEIALWIGVLAIIKRPLLEKVFWGFAGFILLSPVVHPWYLTWLAALLALRWSISIFVFLGLSNIANIVVYQYRSYGQWNDQPLLLLLEYVPVFALLIGEIVHGDVLRSHTDDPKGDVL